jgi:predicted esterase
MPLSLNELSELYVLQMRYHQLNNPEDCVFVRLAKKYLQEMGIDIRIEYAMGKDSYHQQPMIPYILFKPKAVNKDAPAPLVIHTHGGPHVVFKDTTLHAEIIYCLSHGMVVACPNYRGSLALESSPHPDEALWASWIDRSKGAHHLLGPEDVFTVTEDMMQQDYIDKGRVFLRGGSAGSMINAHLLAEIKRGKFPSVYQGVLLAGGLKYPLPTEIPDDVPLYIAHAEDDPISPFNEAELFATVLADHRQSLPDSAPLVLCLVDSGGHHFIAPETSLSDKKSRSYILMQRYLRTSMVFTCHCLQLPLGDLDLEDHSVENADSVETPAVDVRLINDCVPLVTHFNREQEMAVTTTAIPSRIGPSMAYLKLVLGDKATGDIRTDMRLFLLQHVHPIEWESPGRPPLTHAGRDMLQAKGFFDQMVMNISREQQYLSANPNHMVLYHSCDHPTLLLYTVITLWRKVLTGERETDMRHIDYTRLFSFDISAFENIQPFLERMRKRRQKKDYGFNFTDGFANNAFATNLGLTFNEYNTASFTMWWFYKNGGTNVAPYKIVIEELLKSLGIFNEARLTRYLTLFDQLIQCAIQSGIEQNLLQQVFVDSDALDNGGYMCGLWGEEFKKNASDLSRPSTLLELETDPQAFEARMRQEKEAFFKPDSLTASQFGDECEDFNYTGSLQARVLANTFLQGVTFSTVRDPALFQESLNRIITLIREDFQAYVLNDARVPDAMFPGGARVKNALRTHLKMAPAEDVEDAALITIYSRFHQYLIENPHPHIYRDMWLGVSKAQKGRVQIALREKDILITNKPHLFSLCRFLKGYTYFDLLTMLIDNSFVMQFAPVDKTIERYLSENVSLQSTLERGDSALKSRQISYNLERLEIERKIRECLEGTKQEFLTTVQRYCLPKSMDDLKGMNSDLYHRFGQTLLNAINHSKLDWGKFDYIQPKEGELYKSYMLDNELRFLNDLVTSYARIAKEKGNGHDMGHARAAVF